MSVDRGLLGGRYRLEGLIGRGGMASVWRAHDTVLGRPVAVKRLHARLQEDPELAERFRREGQAVSRLSHPNLVRLLDQGQEGDEPFLVFELVEGRDLKTLVRRDGPLPPHRAASVCGQVARALAAAHAAGVVHRDIKSHNVLVTDDGIAKLTDFGIARIVEAEGPSNLTRTGIVMGSSDYLAPEQAEGRVVDERSDIYSLGVVLFEALTGRLPFQGENAVAVATKHVYEAAPDPRSLASGIPPDLAAAVTRALDKRPEHRFATASAFAEALDGDVTATRAAPLIGGDPTEDDGPTGRLLPVTRSRRPLLIAAVSAVGLAAIAGAAWWSGLFGEGGDAAAATASKMSIAITDHDPIGNDGEHPDTAANAIDGSTDTAWTTETYKQLLSTLKSGVGLRATLAGTGTVSRVRIWSASPGAQVAILGSGTDEPATRPILANATLAEGWTDIPLAAPATTGELVVWLTELPQTVESGRYQASIGEVEVYGVANS